VFDLSPLTRSDLSSSELTEFVSRDNNDEMDSKQVGLRLPLFVSHNCSRIVPNGSDHNHARHWTSASFLRVS
jgi:hypothetical protein